MTHAITPSDLKRLSRRSEAAAMRALRTGLAAEAAEAKCAKAPTKASCARAARLRHLTGEHHRAWTAAEAEHSNARGVWTKALHAIERKGLPEPKAPKPTKKPKAAKTKRK